MSSIHNDYHMTSKVRDKVSRLLLVSEVARELNMDKAMARKALTAVFTAIQTLLIQQTAKTEKDGVMLQVPPMGWFYTTFVEPQRKYCFHTGELIDGKPGIRLRFVKSDKFYKALRELAKDDSTQS